MNPRDYLRTAALAFGKPHSFITSAMAMRTRYVLIHFLLIFAVLYFPVFTTVVRTQPHQMYARVFGIQFDQAVFVFYRDVNLQDSLILGGRVPTITIFADYVVFSDRNVTLSAPARFFDLETTPLPYSFTEMFSMLAVYNMYIPHLLVPMLLLSMFITLVLKVFFYGVTAYFLGAFRIRSDYFTFGCRLKITVMSSLPIAVICAAVGFVLPIIHIILFQPLIILLLFYLSKRYDLKEKEMTEVF